MANNASNSVSSDKVNDRIAQAIDEINQNIAQRIDELHDQSMNQQNTPEQESEHLLSRAASLLHWSAGWLEGSELSDKRAERMSEVAELIDQHLSALKQS